MKTISNPTAPASDRPPTERTNLVNLTIEDFLAWAAEEESLHAVRERRIPRRRRAGAGQRPEPRRGCGAPVERSSRLLCATRGPCRDRLIRRQHRHPQGELAKLRRLHHDGRCSEPGG